jgi:hypothetical protein
MKCDCVQEGSEITKLCPLHRRAALDLPIQNFDEFVGKATADILQRFVTEGVSGIRGGLISWLPGYVRWWQSQQKKSA